jgi:hypothetical protein
MICTRMIASSGERSRPPIGGKTRRIGPRTGSVMSASTLPIAPAFGLNQLSRARTMIAPIRTSPKIEMKLAMNAMESLLRAPDGRQKLHDQAALL